MVSPRGPEAAQRVSPVSLGIVGRMSCDDRDVWESISRRNEAQSGQAQPLDSGA